MTKPMQALPVQILLFGSNGQVGWASQRALAPIGQVKALDVDECDLADPASIRQAIQTFKPQVIVNAAAYTAVDKAESDTAMAYQINAEAVRAMADEAVQLGALLVHYSTDYVFDGDKDGVYFETDATNPQSVYGASKHAGELALIESACAHQIFRTSWVCSTHGGNFAKTMLRLARERESLNVVADQWGAPTSAELIADVTAHAIHAWLYASENGRERSKYEGLFHLVAAGETNWHEYASFVIAEAMARGVTLKAAPERVQPIASSAYPQVAKRPMNSRLDTSKLRETFELDLPDWRLHVQRLVADLGDKA